MRWSGVKQMVLDSKLLELNRRIEQAALHSEVTEDGRNKDVVN
jgi:hypothetical protein